MRRRLENFFLKNASGLVEDMSEHQGGRLADALEDLEARSARAAVAEVRAAELERRIARYGPAYEDDRTQIEHLLAELETRDSELAELRPRLEEAQVKLAGSVAEIRARDESLAQEARSKDEHEARVRELTEAAASARTALAREEAARERAESTLRGHEATERERARASLEIGRQRTALAEREADLARRERALAGLAEREEALERRAAELDERDGAAASAERLAAQDARRLADLEAALDARARALETEAAVTAVRTAAEGWAATEHEPRDGEVSVEPDRPPVGLRESWDARDDDPRARLRGRGSWPLGPAPGY